MITICVLRSRRDSLRVVGRDRQTDGEGAAITCRDTGALLFSHVLSRMLKVAFTSVQKEACVPGERAHMSTSQFVVNHKVYKLSN